jgi:hypothetical protein
MRNRLIEVESLQYGVGRGLRGKQAGAGKAAAACPALQFEAS